MAPILRASTLRCRPMLVPRRGVSPLPTRTTIPPSQQRSSGGGASSSSSYFGCCPSRRFLPPCLGPAPVRCLPGGSHLGRLRAEVSRVQGVGGGGFATASAGGGGGGLLFPFLSWYLNALIKYPVSMKSVTSALLTLAGDLICQLLIDQVPELDLKRTFVFTFLGLVLVGPTLHFWYLYLSKVVTLQGASGALLRLLLDQFIFSPIFLGVFLSSLVTLEGRPSQVVPKLQQEWFSSVVANWKLWIPFQFLNFWFVPQQFQVLGANFVALVWNVILSFKAHKEIKQEYLTE